MGTVHVGTADGRCDTPAVAHGADYRTYGVVHMHLDDDGPLVAGHGGTDDGVVVGNDTTDGVNGLCNDGCGDR